jgi:hypothetical protein
MEYTEDSPLGVEPDINHIRLVVSRGYSRYRRFHCEGELPRGYVDESLAAVSLGLDVNINKSGNN